LPNQSVHPIACFAALRETLNVGQLLKKEKQMKMGVIVGVWSVLAMVAMGNEQATDIRVQAGDVTDSRTTGKFFAKLKIELKLMGDDLDGAKGLRCTVTKAIDDTGRNLLKEEKKTSSFSDINDNNPNQTQVTVELKNPSRKAALVTELSGEIDVFRPGKDPASMVMVTNLVGSPKIVVSHPSLTAAQIQMTVLSKAQYDADLQAEKKAAEAKAKSDAETRGEDMGKALADNMGKTLTGMFGGGMMGEKNSVIIRLRDPQSKLVKVEFLDESDKTIQRNGMSWTSDVQCYNFSEPLPQGAKLRINVATPNSVVKVPLMLKDLALP
jgi:hypothetical protein